MELIKPRPAVMAALPSTLNPDLVKGVLKMGVKFLYVKFLVLDSWILSVCEFLVFGSILVNKVDVVGIT